MPRQRRTFTPEFKLQMVKLYENGKSRAAIAREYDLTPSGLDRWIKNHQETGSIVSDLTYVRVNGKWHYVCLFVDLFNREIIGYSAGKHKTAGLVYKALASI